MSTLSAKLTLAFDMGPARKSTSSSKKRRKRSVYVVARPLKSAGHLSFLSRGKLPLCHWGVLVSRYGPAELQSRCASESKDSKLSSWGTVFELFRTPENKNLYHVIEDFGPAELANEWSCVCITFVGKTTMSNHKLAVACIFPSSPS